MKAIATVMTLCAVLLVPLLSAQALSSTGEHDHDFCKTGQVQCPDDPLLNPLGCGCIRYCKLEAWNLCVDLYDAWQDKIEECEQLEEDAPGLLLLLTLPLTTVGGALGAADRVLDCEEEEEQALEEYQACSMALGEYCSPIRPKEH